jgi:hypothetical protein
MLLQHPRWMNLPTKHPEIPPFTSGALARLRIAVVDTAEERARFAAFLTAEHYLSAPAKVGDELRQVATIDGQWVALLLWGPAAFRLRERDEWIGWDAHTRSQRQKLVVQNRRFLVLGHVRQPNLASAVLGAAVRVLPEHWQAAHGYSPLVAETFTDPERFVGTCYKAAGWIGLGHTAGYSRVRAKTYYARHERPKRLWVRPLVADALVRLRTAPRAEPTAPGEVAAPTGQLPVSAAQLDSLMIAFRQVPDPRRGRRFQLATVLTLTSLGLLAGARDLAGIQRFATRLKARQRESVFLPLKKGTKVRLVPSYSVFYEVLSRVDPEAFAAVLTGWLQAHAGRLPQALALDGKAVRDRIQLVTFSAHEDGSPVAVAVCADKGSEMVTAQALLKRTAPGPFSEALVTADALHCQAKTAELLHRDHGADYLLQIKANQPGMLKTAKRLSSQSVPIFL